MSRQKTALITGSSQGLGLETAKALDKLNISVILTGRSLQKLEATLDQFSSKSPVILQGDLTDDNELKRIIDTIKQEHLSPDIIIHNLGKTVTGDTFPLSVDTLRASLKINLEVAVTLNNAFLPHMIRNHYGKIVHVSSDGSLTGRCSPGYAACKAAINAYVKSAARYYAKDQVMICAVLPGVFEHENSAWAERKHAQPDYYQQRVSQMPLGRFARPAEIASYIADIVTNPSMMSAGSLFELTGAY